MPVLWHPVRIHSNIPTRYSILYFTPSLPHMQAYPVWLKYCVASSCLAMIVAAQSTEALPPHHVPRLATHWPLLHDQLVGESLMIALRMIVGQVLVDRIRQDAFTQHDHLFQRLLLDGAHKPFTVGVQIGTPWW